MKASYFVFILLATGIMMAACKKEPTVTASPAKGNLKSLTSGDCNPLLVNGHYEKDSLLTTDNYIDIQVEITQTGTYSIATDTVNAYYFTASGFATDPGTLDIRLVGAGRPYKSNAPGTADTFHIPFDGQKCTAAIAVL